MRIIDSGPAVFLSLLALVGRADADSIEWVGYQNDCTGPLTSASFFHGDNWFNYLVPDSSDAALFGSGFDPADDGYPQYLYFGDVCISAGPCPNQTDIPGGAARTDQLLLQHGTWTFDFGPGQIDGSCDFSMSPGSYSIRRQAKIGMPRWVAGGPGVATLEILNGLFEVEEIDATSVLILGDTEDGEGTLIVRGSAEARAPLAVVGAGGVGHLVLDPGAVMQIDQELRVAQGAGSVGTVNVVGPGAELMARDVFLGGWPFNDGVSDGTLTISSGGSLTVTQGLSLGLGGTGAAGHLAITGVEAEARTRNVAIGQDDDGDAEVHDHGLLQASEEITVGWRGEGMLSVASGGRVVDVFGLNLGREASGVGTVVVDAGEIEGGGLKVGWFGEGHLTIESGGTASRSGTLVGEMMGSSGSIVVTGAGSSLSPGDLVVVGVSGEGSLSVSAGGVVNSGGSGQLRVGQADGAAGTVTLSGPGSMWNGLAGAAIAGFNDTPASGNLSVLDGAQFGAEWILVGTGNAATEGAVEVAGGGASLTASSVMYVGDQGTGALTVGNAGTATIVPIVGHDGDGSLHIQDGGTVLVPAGAQTLFGNRPSGVGHLVIEGSGASLAASDLIVIGVSGSATASLAEGAQILSGGGEVRIAQQEGATASVTIDASSWVGITGLQIGGWAFGATPADGSLHIRGGGTMEAADIRVGDGNEEAVGFVSVANDGSTLVSSGALFVGEEGDGTLAVSDSAAVEASSVGAGSQDGGLGYIALSNHGALVAEGTVTIGGQGRAVLELDGGRVSCTTLEIAHGGSLIGDGIIEGNVLLTGGGLAPGDEDGDRTGVMSIDGDLEVDDDAPDLVPAELDIAAPAPLDDHDKIQSSGNIVLGGNLVVNLIDGYSPAPGDSVALLEFAGTGSPIVGGTDFDCFTGLDIGDSLSFVPVIGQNVYALVVGPPSGNGAPVAAPDSADTPQDTPVTLDVVANDMDADGDDVRVYAIGASPSNGVATIESDITIRYEPNPGFVGVDVFTYEVTDCLGGGAAGTVVVDVGNPTSLPEDQGSGGPFGDALLRVAPNPFDRVTDIRWVLPEDRNVRIAVYDVRGKRVRQLAEGRFRAGDHVLTWEGLDAEEQRVPAGVYFVRYRDDAQRESRSVVVIR